MKSVFNIALVSFLSNALSCLVLSFGMLGIFILALSLVTQLILGIVYAVNKEKKAIGQGLLIGLGVFMVVGFSVCTVLLINIH